jgi:hypothetical protein
MERTFVIGDIGGHHDELWAALVDLGIDPHTNVLPAHVTVVQLGDLIGRGPAEQAAVALAREVQSCNPDAWIQLAGNHEVNQLGVREFSAAPDPAAVAELVDWATAGGLHLAAHIGDKWLITHAGLSAGLWEILGAPSTASQAARLIDQAWPLPDLRAAVTASGIMVSGNRTNRRAGVIWAEAGSELYRPWLHAPLPFNQVHGHSSAYWWSRAAWSAPTDVIPRCSFDAAARHVTFKSPTKHGHLIKGIDPSFGRYTRARWQPLVLPGRALPGHDPLYPLS